MSSPSLPTAARRRAGVPHKQHKSKEYKVKTGKVVIIAALTISGGALLAKKLKVKAPGFND
jgi:hypothetical protein